MHRNVGLGLGFMLFIVKRITKFSLTQLKNEKNIRKKSVRC